MDMNATSSTQTIPNIHPLIFPHIVSCNHNRVQPNQNFLAKYAKDNTSKQKFLYTNQFMFQGTAPSHALHDGNYRKEASFKPTHFSYAHGGGTKDMVATLKPSLIFTETLWLKFIPATTTVYNNSVQQPRQCCITISKLLLAHKAQHQTCSLFPILHIFAPNVFLFLDFNCLQRAFLCSTAQRTITIYFIVSRHHSTVPRPRYYCASTFRSKGPLPTKHANKHKNTTTSIH